MPSLPFSGTVTLDEVTDWIDDHGLGDTPEAKRADYEALLLGDDPGPQPGRDDTWGGVAGRTVGDGTPRVVWFHGGGNVFGSPRTHARAAKALAERLGAAVFLPDLRLAPEHVWPAQKEDALAVAEALMDEAGEIGLVGDSSGGHLSVVSALALAGRGRPPAAVVAFSPDADRTGLSDTREANTPRDAMNSDEDDRENYEIAFPNHPDDDPDVSPVLADLSALPPTHVEVGSVEVLLGEDRILVERAQAAGAEASIHVEPDAFHMWQLWAPWLPQAGASLDRAAAFLRPRLGI